MAAIIIGRMRRIRTIPTMRPTLVVLEVPVVFMKGPFGSVGATAAKKKTETKQIRIKQQQKMKLKNETTTETEAEKTSKTTTTKE